MSLIHENVSAKDLNKSQRKALLRVVRYYRQRENYSGVTSVRFEVNRVRTDGLSEKANEESLRFASYYAVVWTRRSDCHEYSERQIICKNRCHFSLGKRGGIGWLDISSGLESNRKAIFNHFVDMIGGTIPRSVYTKLKGPRTIQQVCEQHDKEES